MICLSPFGTSMLPSKTAQLQLQTLAQGTFTTRKEVVLHVACCFWAAVEDIAYASKLSCIRAQLTSFTLQACVQLAAELRRKPTPLQRTKQRLHLGQATLSLMTPAQRPLLQRRICRCVQHMTELVRCLQRYCACFSSVCRNVSVPSDFKTGCRILPSQFTSASCRLTPAILMRQETMRIPC